MKVSVLANDLSMNSLGRAWLIASLAERNHEVEIVGPQFSDEIWYPMKDNFKYKSVRSSSRTYRFAFDIPDLLDQIDGDVVYASKPLISSFGVGILSKYFQDKPLILDIDDWESGFVQDEHSNLRTYVRGLIRSPELNSFYFIRGLERLHKTADAITISNSFLQSKFGGTIIPHVRDTTKFDPNKFDKQEEREQLGLPENKHIVMFSGTPRPHKGLDLLIKACNRMNREEFALVLVGANRENQLIQQLPDSSGYPIYYEGMQPFDKLPQYIAASDVICIPQRKTSSSVGQLPAKLFDAMSMGKPVVSSSVSDIEEILGDCGIVVPPDDVGALKEGIEKLLDDDSLRSALGTKAREKCINEYSVERYAQVVDEVIRSIEH